MSEEISHPFSLTNCEFEILQKAVYAREKKLRADAERCRLAYDGKASTAEKQRLYKIEADELNELISKIAQEFS
jgi:hypothetical protein